MDILKSAKAVGVGEIKIKRDGQDVTLPAVQFNNEGKFLLAFGVWDAATNDWRETIGFTLDLGDIGKEVEHPENGSWIQAKFQGVENFASSGKIYVSKDWIGDTYFGRLSAKFTDADATIGDLTDGIFSYKVR